MDLPTLHTTLFYSALVMTAGALFVTCLTAYIALSFFRLFQDTSGMENRLKDEIGREITKTLESNDGLGKPLHRIVDKEESETAQNRVFKEEDDDDNQHERH